MESQTNKIINEYLTGENAKFLLPKYKNEIENWIRDNIEDDFYKGELVDITMQSIQKLFLCKSNFAVFSVYDDIIVSLRKVQWGIAINEVINVVSRYAKNGEKLFKLHYKNLNEKQMNFYNSIKQEHLDFYENSKEQ